MVIKLFFMLISAEAKIYSAHKINVIIIPTLLISYILIGFSEDFIQGHHYLS